MNALINKIQDSRANRIYADVQGQMSNENHPDIFGPELLPGETIIREFREFTIDEAMPIWKTIPCCICYLVYAYLCVCLRALDVGNRRTRLAFTDQGRLMIWSSELSGTRGGLADCCSVQYKSRTNMQWFHCKDINSFQFEIHRKNNCGPIDCLGMEDRARLRLYFGQRYPRTSLLQELDTTESGALQGMKRPQWGRARQLTGNLGQGTEDDEEEGGLLSAIVGVFHTIAFGIFTCVTCARYYQPARAIPLVYGARGEFPLTIQSLSEEDTHDGYHDEPGEAWEEMMNLVRTLTIAKDPQRLPNVEPNEHAFAVTTSQDMEEARDTKLVEGPKPMMDYKKFPLIDDEQTIDALKIQPRMSWWECMFAWQWCSLCRKAKYKMDAAVFLTSYRAFSCTEHRPSAGEYQFAMTAYFIGKLGGGMAVTDPDGSLGYSIDVATEYGALRLKPIMSEMWPWSAEVPDKQKDRMFNFMYNLERACYTQQYIPAPAEGSLPNQEDVQEALEYINLWDDEEVCSVVKSANLYNMDPYMGFPFSFLCCGDEVSIKEFIKTVCCGCRPWRLDEFLVLTTHRLVAFQRSANDAKIGFFEGKANVLLWLPLSDVEAMQFDAVYTAAPANILTQACASVCRCCNDNSAHLYVSLGTNSSYKTAPLGVGRLAAHAQSGLLEGRADLRHFRAAFAYYQSKSSIPKGDYLEPVIYREEYGKTPWPERLQDEEGVTNPMVGSGGESTALIGVGTSGG